MNKIDISNDVAKKSKRLLSIDALRGFDMLLITGFGSFLVLMEGKTNWPWVDVVAHQMEHPAWIGFTFYDFIFPLFLFIAGVSISFSLNKELKLGVSKSDLYRKAFWRMLILIILGIIDKNIPLPYFHPSEIRIPSILGRIGIAGFLTTILYLNFSWRALFGWVVGILLVYYAIIFLIPAPGFQAGDLTHEGNLIGWIDRTFLPGRLLEKTYDELGIITQFPALCLTVFGVMAGDLLRSDQKDNKKLQILVFAGIVGIGLGLLWSLHFPVSKKLWTSSFILLTGGMASLFMAFFYWVIDVLKYQKWAFFFQVIGLNSLTIYMSARFINYNYASHRIFSGLYTPLPETWYPVFDAFGAAIVAWLLMYFLYRKKIFIKI